MSDQNNQEQKELQDIDRIMYFLREQYGDGNTIDSKGMEELKQTFITSRIINKRANKAKSIIFSTIIYTITGALLYVTWEGIRASILGKVPGG